MEKKQYPKISIITPCFNSDKYLEETILSVLGQNYPNLEYIIIDGGSTDKTVEIIKKYQDKLTFWISEKDNGMYEAIQKGFNRSTGEIMAWINSDDMYHKNSFYTVAEIFQNFQEIKWLLGAVTLWDEYGRCIGVDKSKKFTRLDFLTRNFKWLQQESCFFRRELWEKAGGYVDASLRYAGDFELWLRFFRHEKLFVTDALVGGFRMRTSGQLSVDGVEKYWAELKKCVKKEPVGVFERFKILRYKIVVAIFKQIDKILSKILSKYKKLECGYSNEITFNRKLQKFEKRTF
ncbi:MAG: glycosyltransferase [Chitinivibrionia bacterium]|nr:glycosyltransferase [Chitinivibrionia bacterium]